MNITALKSRPLLPPKDDLFAALDEALPSASWRMPERSVVAVSSKVVAIGEGRCVLPPAGLDERGLLEYKDTLAQEEAEYYIPRDQEQQYSCFFALKESVFIPSAGIDQSNGNGYFILWPTDALHSAREIRAHLMKRHDISDLGVLITDSTSAPLRNGVTGKAIGYAGFRALYDYRGQQDIFGRQLKSERLNIADSIAAAAVLAMGEGNECAPFVLIEDIPHIVFSETESEDPLLSLSVSMVDDIFAPFFKLAPWRRGGKRE